MKITQNVTPEILAGAASLLKPYVPGLTPRGLVQALQGFDADESQPEPPAVKKLLTIQQAAKALDLSVMSVHRLFRDGKLTRRKVGRRAVRIFADEINTMLNA